MDYLKGGGDLMFNMFLTRALDLPGITMGTVYAVIEKILTGADILSILATIGAVGLGTAVVFTLKQIVWMYIKRYGRRYVAWKIYTF